MSGTGLVALRPALSADPCGHSIEPCGAQDQIQFEMVRRLLSTRTHASSLSGIGVTQVQECLMYCTFGEEGLIVDLIA
jgi:hypothetical protein